MRAMGRLELFKTRRDQPDEEITLEYVLDKLVIAGTPALGGRAAAAFQEETGPFGELVYAGMDWVDPDLGRARWS